MKLVSLRIITDDLKRLVHFYETVTGAAVTLYTEDFGELSTPGGTLAIASTRTLALFGDPGMARPADNRSVILEFRVDDVDAQYARLRGMLGEHLVQAPATMPWGNRSLLFRDPDGNLVNYFTPLTEAAIARAEGR